MRIATITTALAVGLAGAVVAVPQASGNSTVLQGTALDGDSIKPTRGSEIRVVGVNSPGMGECGYADAKRLTNKFISGGFTVGRPYKGKAKDSQGRRLRYVANPQGKDLGRKLIRKGLARPAYDSRDGGKAHKKEKRYRKLAKKKPSACAPPKTNDGSTPTKLKIATYNICYIGCPSSPPWDLRRDAVFNTLRLPGADVIGLQEASNSNNQRADVAAAMNESGYTLVPEVSECANDCVDGAGILFRRSTVQLATPPTGGPSSGLVSFESLTGPEAYGNLRDRGFAWALLEHPATGKKFLAASIHLSSDQTAQGELSRQASARALTPWLRNLANSWGLTNLPIFIAGDLNSYSGRNPGGAQAIFAEAGFTDGYYSKREKNARYATSNFANGAGGWPERPIKFSGQPPRIDYIWGASARATRIPMKYEVVIKTTSDGDFNPSYQGSDHNLVIVKWKLPAG